MDATLSLQPLGLTVGAVGAVAALAAWYFVWRLYRASKKSGEKK